MLRILPMPTSCPWHALVQVALSSGPATAEIRSSSTNVECVSIQASGHRGIGASEAYKGWRGGVAGWGGPLLRPPLAMYGAHELIPVLVYDLMPIGGL